MSEWNCKMEGEHYDALSGCCGGEEHSDVEGMCGACNEWTGWYCSICDEDVSEDMYNWARHPEKGWVWEEPSNLHSALSAVWGKPVYNDGDITIYQGGGE